MTRFWDSMLGRSGPYAVMPSGAATKSISAGANAAIKTSRARSVDANANIGITVSLVSEYGLNGGSAADAISGVNGTVVGSWGPNQASLVQGDAGTSMYKDGTGSAHISLPQNNPIHDLDALTISMYYEPNTNPGQKEGLFTCGDTTVPGDFAIERNFNGLLRGFHVGQDGTFRFFQDTNGITGSDLLKGIAHRITFSFGPATAKIYRDGALLTTIPNNTNGWNNARTKRIGCWDNPIENQLNGAVDLIRIWRGQLTDTQVGALPAAVSVSLPQPPPPTGNLEPINPSALQVSMSVGSTPQQRWDGFGWGMGPPDYASTVTFNGKNQTATIQQWPSRMFSELNAKWLHGYSADSRYQQLVNYGLTQGITGVICSGVIYSSTPDRTGTDLANDIQNSGVGWTHVSLQNEPDGAPGNDFPGLSTGNFGQLITDLQALRTRLNQLGKSGVKTIGVGWAHFDSRPEIEYDQFKTAGLVPAPFGNGILSAGNGHAYQDCCRATGWDSRWAAHKPQGLFQSECGEHSLPNSAARFVACANNGMGIFICHGGQAMGSTANELRQTLVENNGTRRPVHGPFSIFSQALPLGSLCRIVTSSDWPTLADGTSPTKINPSTGQPYTFSQRLGQAAAQRMQRGPTGVIGPNPRINTSVWKRPDGQWTILAVNATEPGGVYESFGGNAYPAKLIQLTFTIPELSGFTGNFSGPRCSKAGVVGATETKAMVNGTLVCTVNEGESLALVG